MPPIEDHPNTKFDTEARAKYIRLLQAGHLKFEATRMVGVSYRSVVRRRRNDPDFAEEEAYALAEAREEVEAILFALAKAGDLKAADMWLKAHDKSTYGQQATVTIDATPAALEMSQNDALARIAELQTTLTQRRQELEADDVPVLDVASEEL